MGSSSSDVSAWIVAVSSVLSLLGSGVIVVSYAVWPRIRTKSRLLLVCLSLADYACAAGYGASALFFLFHGTEHLQDDSFSCKFQSAVTTWSSIATFCWTVVMAVYLYIAIVHDAVDAAKKLFPLYAALSLFIPTLVTAGALLSNALGYGGGFVTSGWCWVDEYPDWPSFAASGEKEKYAHARLFWQLVAGKFWEVSGCIIIFVLYFLIRRHIRQKTLFSNSQFFTDGSRSAAARADRKMVAIPVAFLFLRIWGTVRFILEYADPDAPASKYLALVYLQAVGDTGQGFVNFFIFCWKTDSVQGLMVGAFYSCCCCCCRPCKGKSGDGDTESDSLLHRDAPPAVQNSGACMETKANNNGLTASQVIEASAEIKAKDG